MSEMKDALRQFRKKEMPGTFAAKVLSVDTEKGICSIEADELEYDQVRLAAVINPTNAHYIIPSVDSQVLVSSLEDDLNLLYVVAYSEVAAMNVTINNTSIAINENQIVIDHNGNKLKINANGHLLTSDQATYRLDGQGHSIKNGSENLAQILADLLQAIQQITVTNSAGPSGVPNNVAAFTALQPRIENLLKND